MVSIEALKKQKCFGQLFSNVFAVEEELQNSLIPLKPCHSPIEELIFNQQQSLI